MRHAVCSRVARRRASTASPPSASCTHADQLVERVFTLDGLPNLQDLGKLLIGESAVETLRFGLKVELMSQVHLKAAIACCKAVRDYVSRELLEHILGATDEHIDHLETRIELVAKVGEPNYLQSQMGSASAGQRRR